MMFRHFRQGTQFCDFLFALQHIKTLKKGLFYKEKICFLRLGLLFHSGTRQPSNHTISQKRRYKIAATSQRCSDDVTTLLQRYVFAGNFDRVVSLGSLPFLFNSVLKKAWIHACSDKKKKKTENRSFYSFFLYQRLLYFRRLSESRFCLAL